MSKRLALMVSGEFPCIRAGRFALALQNEGWEHDAVCRAYPPQFADAYRNIDFDPYRSHDGLAEAIGRSDAELIHVHNEPNWPVIVAKETTDKPVIMNVHDMTCARPQSPYDEFEQEAFAKADALIFVTEQQREFAKDAGLDIDKPTLIIPNWPSSSVFIEKSVLSHIGGVVYEGGCDKRDIGGWRDLSAVADALDGQFHIYPGGPDPEYGIVHNAVMDYPLLIHELARFDWNFTGTPEPHPSWMQTIPTKVGDGFAAGVPIIAINNPLIKPFCDMGMGVYINDIKELKKVAKLDPKPYKKAVMANRSRFTTEREIGKVAQLYKELLA